MTRREAPFENGGPAGNYGDKHGSANPVTRRLMARFYRALLGLAAETGVRDVHEVGCGEGHLARRLAAAGYRVRGSDVSPAIIGEARALSLAAGDATPFTVRSLYELGEADAAPLVVCCEALEHLARPEEARARLAAAARPYLVASVPAEPLWRMLNMARGTYLARLGNTPGHLQHWSPRGFVRWIARDFDVLRVLHPVPWTMVLARSRGVPA